MWKYENVIWRRMNEYNNVKDMNNVKWIIIMKEE